MKGVVLDQQTFDRGDLDLSSLNIDGIQWSNHNSTLPHQIDERIGDADIVITNKIRLSAESIALAKNLKLVLLAATGTDNVDLPACKQRGIVVCNARQYATPAVVQHVFTLILNLTTNLLRYHQLVQQQQWQKSDIFCLLDFPIRELDGKTMGIIGFGTLGQKVADVARAFGMQVIISQRPGTNSCAQTEGRTALRNVLAQADVLSLHCPLTDDTRHLLGKDEFKIMKKDAILINTARGAIVDSQALIDALKAHEIGGAGIDVLDTEPPTDGHPLINQSLPNLVVTPHNARASVESRQRLVSQLSGNICAWLNQHPQNVVIS